MWTQTSVPGRSESNARAAWLGRLGGCRARSKSPVTSHSVRSRGFTLIEMLIVILIIGVAMAMISIGGLPGSREGLRFETERLAHLLLLAREEAQVRGATIRLDIDEARYRFLIRRNGEWRQVLDDPDLRERPWDRPTRVTIDRSDGKRYVEFGRSTVDIPFSITFLRDNTRLQIQANGLGAFEVQ